MELSVFFSARGFSDYFFPGIPNFRGWRFWEATICTEFSGDFPCEGYFFFPFLLEGFRRLSIFFSGIWIFQEGHIKEGETCIEFPGGGFLRREFSMFYFFTTYMEDLFSPFISGYLKVFRVRGIFNGSHQMLAGFCRRIFDSLIIYIFREKGSFSLFFSQQNRRKCLSCRCYRWKLVHYYFDW